MQIYCNITCPYLAEVDETVRTASDILDLLVALEGDIADSLEDQDLDFKEWDPGSAKNAMRRVTEMAVCMANGGGGTVVFGVRDHVVGRENSILGVPADIESHQLMKVVYDNTEPRLTPVFEELQVPEGTGRLVIMQVHRGMPPYTDASGAGKVRVGKDCMPLTGSMRLMGAAGGNGTDYTLLRVQGSPGDLLCPESMDLLRGLAARESASGDLLSLGDEALMEALGLVCEGELTIGGLLLAGRHEAIRAALPAYSWMHLSYGPNEAYVGRLSGSDTILAAIARLLQATEDYNPVQEGRAYPQTALHEALMNAFVHADYTIPSPIAVRQHPGRLEIANPGGFIGGVTASNVLRHEPVSRNLALVRALSRLQLLGRRGAGVRRMYEAMLEEGKTPPIVEDTGYSVRVNFLAGSPYPAFRGFLSQQRQQGNPVGLDELILLHHLVRYGAADLPTLAEACQTGPALAREILLGMEYSRGYVTRDGIGVGEAWFVRPNLLAQLTQASRTSEGGTGTSGGGAETARIGGGAAPQPSAEAYEELLASILRRHVSGASNAELRAVTGLPRHQVLHHMSRLIANGLAEMIGKGRGVRYRLV